MTSATPTHIGLSRSAGEATPMQGAQRSGEGRVVCRSDRVPPERAMAARATDGTQIALVRTAAGTLHGVGHHDPYSGANVMARGIVGTAVVLDKERDVIISPMYKQAFDLCTGQCTTDPDVNLGVWTVEETEGMIVLRNNRIAPRGVA